MNRFFCLAREGYFFVALAISLLLFSFLFLNIIYWSLSLLVCIFVIQFFRDPIREAKANKDEVVSAADGRVIAIEKMTDPFNKRPSVKVSVFMNVFNVHSNKIPISGEVIKKDYRPGKFFNAALDKASTQNELCAITIRTQDKKLVTSVQIAGLIARRIICYANTGDSFVTGSRYGFIRFGSRVDHYLPINSKIKVKLGEKVKNSVTILAQI